MVTEVGVGVWEPTAVPEKAKTHTAPSRRRKRWPRESKRYCIRIARLQAIAKKDGDVRLWR